MFQIHSTLLGYFPGKFGDWNVPLFCVKVNLQPEKNGENKMMQQHETTEDVEPKV